MQNNSQGKVLNKERFQNLPALYTYQKIHKAFEIIKKIKISNFEEDWDKLQGRTFLQRLSPRL